jgi:hypothetical protein
MDIIERFRAALSERDLGALKDLLAPGIRLFTPAKVAPLEGREAILGVFGVLLGRVFDDFRCVGEVNGATEKSRGRKASTHILIFRTKVSGRLAHGIYLIHLDEYGLIDELSVMVRPQAAVDALGAAVRDRPRAEVSTGAWHAA